MVLLYSTLKRGYSLSCHLLPPAAWKAGVLAGAPATTLGYEAQGHTLGTVGQDTGRSMSQGRSGKLQCQLWTALPIDCNLPGSSVNGISQERILEWVSPFLLQGNLLTQGSNLCLLY